MAKALAKVPTERYGTCPEFAAALRQACGLESGPGLVPGPAADFPDVPLRESTQVVPVVPADHEQTGVAGPVSPSDPGSGTGEPGPASPVPASPVPSRLAPPPRILARPPGTRARPSKTPGPPAGNPARLPSCPGLPAPVPKPSPHRPASRRLTGTGPGPRRRDLPPRRLRCRPTPRGMFPAVTPGGYAPGPPGRPPAFSRRPAPGRPEPPRRRRGLWAAAALAVVVVLAAVGYFVKNSFSTGAKTTGSAQVVSVKPPGCTTQTAKGAQLKHVGSHLVATGGNPFDVETVPGFAFVSGAGSGLAVMNTQNSVPARMWDSAPLDHAQGEALTPNGHFLVVTGGSGITVFRVSDLEQGAGANKVGSLVSPGQMHAEDVAITPDGNFAFVTFQNSASVGVFDLQRALSSGFGPGDVVGHIPVGPQPIGIAIPPDGQHAYVASQASTPGSGELSIIDVRQAEQHPGASSVIKKVPAGCKANRIVFTAGGQKLWVTAAGSNALLGFSTAKLLSDPGHALLARVAVGQSPLGLAVISHGNRIVVADSNKQAQPGSVPNLAVVDTAKALAGKPALVGYLRSGLQPRQFAVVSQSHTLLVTNTKSAQLQTVDLSRLP